MHTYWNRIKAVKTYKQQPVILEIAVEILGSFKAFWKTLCKSIPPINIKRVKLYIIILPEIKYIEKYTEHHVNRYQCG